MVNHLKTWQKFKGPIVACFGKVYLNATEVFSQFGPMKNFLRAIYKTAWPKCLLLIQSIPRWRTCMQSEVSVVQKGNKNYTHEILHRNTSELSAFLQLHRRFTCCVKQTGSRFHLLLGCTQRFHFVVKQLITVSLPIKYFFPEPWPRAGRTDCAGNYLLRHRTKENKPFLPRGNK